MSKEASSPGAEYGKLCSAPSACDEAAALNFVFFSDHKIFTVAPSVKFQNNCVYMIQTKQCKRLMVTNCCTIV